MTRLIAALLLLAAPALAAPTLAASVKLKIGDPAPLFARADLQGHAFDLKAQRGKIVLIDFWASWCGPCMIAIPHLGQLQERYGKNGFQVVGISMDDSPSQTKETMKKIAFRYPVVMGDAKFGNLFGGVLGLPLEYLVGADGKILGIWNDVPPATLDKAVAAALKAAK